MVSQAGVEPALIQLCTYWVETRANTGTLCYNYILTREKVKWFFIYPD